MPRHCGVVRGAVLRCLLLTANGPYGQITYYYDGVGNRTYEITTVGSNTSTKVTSYSAASNQMTQVLTDGTVTRTFGYDAAGNLTTDTHDGTAWTYAYNNAGRLATATAGSSLMGSYTYDGLERLAVRVVTNTTPSGTTHLVYDTAGHVIAEANGLSGVTLREYVWLPNEEAADLGPTSGPSAGGLSTGRLGAAEGGDDPTSPSRLMSLAHPKPGMATSAMPLAVLSGVDTGSPVTYYVHTDHLDRPIKMTDASKNSVWDAVYKPYGEAYSITGTASLDARFPGQWFELETGLAYNWHRHYDATTGRYTSPDPLGFADGPSVFAYAGNSPQMRLDRRGLAGLSDGPMTPIRRSSDQVCKSSSPLTTAAYEPLDCDAAYYQCLTVRGIGRGAMLACSQARTNCLAGVPTIFAPGIVGRPQ